MNSVNLILILIIYQSVTLNNCADVDPRDSLNDLMRGLKGTNSKGEEPFESLLSLARKQLKSVNSVSKENPFAKLELLLPLLPSLLNQMFPSSVMESISSTIADNLKSFPSSLRKQRSPTDGQSTRKLISSRGFSYDDHYVTTKDGYILHLFRLINPYAQSSLGSDNLRPILLQHGFISNSEVWLISFPDEKIIPWIDDEKPEVTPGNNLAIFLANHGFDVWLCNNRGNRYSLNHTTLNPETDNDFWNYSLDEYSKEDAPTIIDYIRKVTGKDKLTIVGHSLGSTQFLGMLSFYPEYADYIDLFFALAPIAYMGNIKGPLGRLSSSQIFRDIVSQFNERFPPYDDYDTFSSLIPLLCNQTLTNALCAAGIDYLVGSNYKQMDRSRLLDYLYHLDPVSAKLVNHLLQTRENNAFHLYDYEKEENRNRYNQKDSPIYPFSEIKSDKIVLVSGSGDYMASPKDIHQLRKKLSGKILIDHVIKDPNFNHYDFFYGKNTYENVNQFIIETIEKHSENDSNNLKNKEL